MASWLFTISKISSRIWRYSRSTGLLKSRARRLKSGAVICTNYAWCRRSSAHLWNIVYLLITASRASSKLAISSGWIGTKLSDSTNPLTLWRITAVSLKILKYTVSSSWSNTLEYAPQRVYRCILHSITRELSITPTGSGLIFHSSPREKQTTNTVIPTITTRSTTATVWSSCTVDGCSISWITALTENKYSMILLGILRNWLIKNFLGIIFCRKVRF